MTRRWCGTGGWGALRWALVAVGGALANTPATGAINVSLVPSASSVSVGEAFGMDVWATTSSGAAEGLLSFQVIFSWQSAVVQLMGFNNVGGPSYTALGFLNDPYGLNRTPTITTPPTDGDAILIGLGPFGSSITVPAGGLRLSTLRFTALSESAFSPIDVLASAGSPVGTTAVFGAGGPNIDVTGMLVGSGMQIVPSPGVAMAILGWGCSVSLLRRRRSCS